MKRISLLVAAAALFSGAALAQPGPGMMGPGMMGYGMMGGYGMGPGMMGPGMMGYGYGMGPGMMGPGMMGGYDYYGLDLSPEQRAKISDIRQRLAQQHWDLMGKMHQQGYRMSFYRDGKLDEQAARKGYETMAASHKEMFESWLQAQKQVDAVLTAEQRQKLQRGW